MKSARRGRRAATPWMRSSVERSTREIIDVTMIVTMNHDAILMPSGRSKMFSDRRVDEDQRDQAEPEPRAAGAGRCSVTATAADVISTSTPVA